MKKILLIMIASFCFLQAGVSKTTVGCVDRNDLTKLQELSKMGKLQSIEALYKFSIEHDCEIIDPSLQIRQIGKPASDGVISVYVKKFDKDLYIIKDAISNKYTEDNHLLNKSF